MVTNPLSDMTVEELNALVEEMIDRRLQYLLKPQDHRSTSELLDIIDQHRINLPENAKSSLELLREDRDA